MAQQGQARRVSEGRFVLDHQVPEKIGNIPGVSVQFLRRDRVGAQLIPYHRLGRTCLYDPDEVIEAIRAMRVGGKSTKPTKGRREAEAAP